MKPLFLFRNNLRIDDNPVLLFSSEVNDIIPFYIYDNINFKKELGGVSKYWLYPALNSLNKSLNRFLHYYKGETLKINYPNPIIDYKLSRNRVLERYILIK